MRVSRLASRLVGYTLHTLCLSVAPEDIFAPVDLQEFVFSVPGAPPVKRLRHTSTMLQFRR